MSHILIMIPTYNEMANIVSLINKLIEVRPLVGNADILFIDDDSPDGTGEFLTTVENSFIKVIHRDGKQGIGTAHQVGIIYAYQNKYTHLITMDGDFTHPPEVIPKLLEKSGDYDIVIGGRHAQKESLEGWDAYRKLLTFIGHQFTSKLLHLPYDATSAFRIYRLDVINPRIFMLVESRSYSFFFESLCVLNENGYSIYDIPVVLPPRASGSSKLTLKDMVQCLLLVIKLGITIRSSKNNLKLLPKS
jgi:dolichol-phosphate mannosyltransferase